MSVHFLKRLLEKAIEVHVTQTPTLSDSSQASTDPMQFLECKQLEQSSLATMQQLL